jgi:hypothetical protein
LGIAELKKEAKYAFFHDGALHSRMRCDASRKGVIHERGDTFPTLHEA